MAVGNWQSANMRAKKNILYLWFVVCFLLPTLLFAQKEKPLPDCPSASEDAIKLYEKSQDKKKYEYAERIKYLEKCVEEDPNYAPANYELGMHWQRRADEDNMSSCEKCEQ